MPSDFQQTQAPEIIQGTTTAPPLETDRTSTTKMTLTAVLTHTLMIF